MARKTVSIVWLKEKANHFLAESVDEYVGERSGLTALLEAALHETGNYKGFRYLPSEWDDVTESLRDGYDDTRRMYF